MAHLGLSIGGNDLAVEQLGQPLRRLLIIAIVDHRRKGHDEVQVEGGPVKAADQAREREKSIIEGQRTEKQSIINNENR